MEYYFTKDTCRIEKKHYSFLIRFVQEWEESFRNEDAPEQKLLSSSAMVYAGILLFKAYNEIAANTLDHLYKQELIQSNPMLEWNTELATNEIKEKAEYSLLEKLEQEPQMLFKVSPLLSEHFKLCTLQFSEMLSEMLARIYSDRQEICGAFFDKDDFGRIIKIDGGQGDKHQGGRSTLIITAEGGKFAYKPRNMTADTLLYDMVSELFSDTVILPKALDFGQYGYYLPTIPQLLEFIGEHFTSFPALCEGANEVSFEELVSRVKRRISYLCSLELRDGANIAILSPNNSNAAELFLAVPAAGFMVMLLPVSLGEKELVGITQKYDIAALFTDDEYISVTSGVSCPVYKVDAIGETEAEFAKVSKQTPAAIFLTGGTSEKPKGAVLSHGALMRGAFNGVFAPGHVLRRRYMAMLPFSHVFGSIRGLLSCLYTGSTVYLCTDLKAAISDIPVIRPTTLVLVPGIIEIILGVAKLKGREFLGELSLIISSAAPVPPRLMQECASFGIKVCPGYGLTECANLTTGNNDAEDFPEAVGTVYPEQEIKIIDGELYIKGDNVMLGYYGEPELTAQVLSDGWFRTGDLAELREYKHEQFIVITGRVKNIILLSNGENVSPEELEGLFYCIERKC